MTAEHNRTPDSPRTLPAWLDRQANRRGRSVALRHKREGVWHERTWAEVRREVLELAAGLQRRGFGAGARLIVLSTPRPEALLISLAAQHLGGTAALLDPSDEAAGQIALLTELEPGFVFAEARSEVDRVFAAAIQPAVLLYADARGLASLGKSRGAALQPYADLLDRSTPAPAHSQASADQAAFLVYRRDGKGDVHVLTLTHEELLANAQTLVQQESLTAAEDAFAARAFAASGQARYLVAPWLLAGFRLNYPENLATRDNDRREIGPTLVLGTCATYQRVEHWVQARRPQPGSAFRKLVDWALAPGGGVLRDTLGYWLVRRPLRDVIGFTRTHAPLIVGEPLPEASQRFFATLGIAVRALSEPAHWQPHPAPSAAPAPAKGWLTFPASATRPGHRADWRPA